MNRDKLFATIVTAVTTLSVFLVFLWVFRDKSSDTVEKHFVAKRGEAVAVSLSSSPKKTNRHKVKQKKVKKKKPKPKKRKTVKKTKHIVKKSKTTQKKKVTKKTTNHKKVETKKLFSSITQSSAVSKNSISKKPGEGSGEINRYLAKIEKRLRGWPAQRNFAGEEIDVRLKIYPNGQFEYKIMKYSKNDEFNTALMSYLDDLKRFGFGPHKGGRAYEIEVKFVAHD